MGSFAPILIVICFFSFALYNYLDNLNDLTRLRLAVPQAELALDQKHTEYQQLRDEWAKISSANALYELQTKPGFRHLREYHSPKNESELPSYLPIYQIEELPAISVPHEN